MAFMMWKGQEWVWRKLRKVRCVHGRRRNGVEQGGLVVRRPERCQHAVGVWLGRASAGKGHVRKQGWAGD